MARPPGDDPGPSPRRRFASTPAVRSADLPAIADAGARHPARPADHCVEWVLPAVVEAGATARALVRDAVRDLAETVLDDLEVIVAELVANAIRHGRPEITLRLDVTAAHVDLAVLDHGPGRPVAVADPPAPTASSGRGMLLVDRLAHTWGVDTAVGGEGKAVWARVQLSEPADGASAPPTHREPDEGATAPSA